MTVNAACIRRHEGLTLVELLVSMMIFGVVLSVVSGVFFSGNKAYKKTSNQVKAQMNARLGLEIMTKEIRHAGCDPKEIGITGIVYAGVDSLHLHEDLDGDGVIQTAEPSEDVIYYFDSGAQALYRDPGTGPQVIVQNVSALSFSYRDAGGNVLAPLPLAAADAARVRSVFISMTVRTRSGEDIVYSTSVAIRNT